MYKKTTNADALKDLLQVFESMPSLMAKNSMIVPIATGRSDRGDPETLRTHFQPVFPSLVATVYLLLDSI